MGNHNMNVSKRPRIHLEKSQQKPANKASESSINNSDIDAYLDDNNIDRIEAKINDLSYAKFLQINEKIESRQNAEREEEPASDDDASEMTKNNNKRI